MTKIISTQELVTPTNIDIVMFYTKEDYSKVTRVIAQNEEGETEYTISSIVTDAAPCLKTGWKIIFLIEKNSY